MRGFDRDLIRGGHYGQRPLCAAQTGRTHGCTDQPANVKKSLANSEPSTHGTELPIRGVRSSVAVGGKADLEEAPLNSSIYEYALERFELRARDYEWHVSSPPKL